MAVGKADDVGTVGGDIVVGDCVLAEVATEDIGVVTLTALEMVVTSTTFENIVAVITQNKIVSRSAEQNIVFRSTVDCVITFAAVGKAVTVFRGVDLIAFIVSESPLPCAKKCFAFLIIQSCRKDCRFCIERICGSSVICKGIVQCLHQCACFGNFPCLYHVLSSAGNCLPVAVAFVAGYLR